MFIFIHAFIIFVKKCIYFCFILYEFRCSASGWGTDVADQNFILSFTKLILEYYNNTASFNFKSESSKNILFAFFGNNIHFKVEIN